MSKNARRTISQRIDDTNFVVVYFFFLVLESDASGSGLKFHNFFFLETFFLREYSPNVTGKCGLIFSYSIWNKVDLFASFETRVKHFINLNDVRVSSACYFRP